MLFFIDESGYDHHESPYEVLAGLAISEKKLWGLIQEVQNLEVEMFGARLLDYCVEFKGKKLLKKKVFRHALQLPAMDGEIRRDLCRTFLEKGKSESNGGKLQPRERKEFAAYGQTVLDFIHGVLDLCQSNDVKVFASIVLPEAPKQSGDFLRKDYSYLFERFFYYCEDLSDSEMGIVVFDELEKAKCRVLINQMSRYFRVTHHGQVRSTRIIPEPFFVHSDLTTAVQLVDIIAYCLNWGFRTRPICKPARLELNPYVGKIKTMEYLREMGKNHPKNVYGISFISDLRPRSEKNIK